MMLTRFLSMVSAATTVVILGVPSAQADIYTWVDKSGIVNVSNLAPPEDAKVTKVVHEAPKDPAREAAQREALREAELRVLSDRLQQLEEQLEASRRASYMPPAYAPPPVMPYPDMAPPPAPYIVNVVSQPAAPYAQPTGGCDYSWGDCGFGAWPGFYPATIVVAKGRNHRRYGTVPYAPVQYGGGHLVPPLIPPAPRGVGGRKH